MVGGTGLWFKNPADVLVEKLVSAQRFPEERLRDLEDAVSILDRQEDALEIGYARSRCEDEGVAGILEEALERVQAEE